MVVEQDPGNDKAMKLLGDIWVSSDLSRAIGYYQQAVMLKPAKVEYHIALASALTRAGDRASLGSAADELREALRIDPKNSQARAGLLDVIGRLHRGQ
jgi:cytochrome c-type biogenesis protein CcmH/NrfG